MPSLPPERPSSGASGRYPPIRPLLTIEQLAADELWSLLTHGAERLRREPDLLKSARVLLRNPVGPMRYAATVSMLDAIDCDRVNALLAESRLAESRVVWASATSSFAVFIGEEDEPPSNVGYVHPNGTAEEFLIGEMGPGHDVFDTLDARASRVADALVAWRDERELQMLEAVRDWVVLGVLRGDLGWARPRPPTELRRAEALAARLRHLARQCGIARTERPEELLECVADWVVSEFGVAADDVSRVAVADVVQTLEAVRSGAWGETSVATDARRSFVIRFDPGSLCDGTGNPRSGGRVTVEARGGGEPPRAWSMARKQFDVLQRMVRERRRAVLPDTSAGRHLAHRLIETLARHGVRAQRPKGATACEVELVDDVDLEADVELGRRDRAAGIRRFRNASRGQAMRGDI